MKVIWRPVSETRKRSSSTDQDDESPESRRSRSNGSETVAFLKVKAEKDTDRRQEESRLKSDEVQLQRDLMIAAAARFW